MRLKHKYITTAVLMAGMSFGAVTLCGAEAAAEMPKSFTPQIWQQAEGKFLLTNAEYMELLKVAAADLTMLEAWRSQQISNPEMLELNAKLSASVQSENLLTGDENRNLLYLQRRESDRIRNEIDNWWRKREKTEEFQSLVRKSDESNKKLYDAACKILAKNKDSDAKAALSMLNTTGAIAIPRQLEKVSTAKKVVKNAAMPMDDVELFKKYEKEYLLKNPAYTLAKGRSDKAFNILSQWQELQMTGTPEGNTALADFQTAAAQVTKLAAAEPVNQAKLESAQETLRLESENLRKFQAEMFRNDRQNRILTDSYYEARHEALVKAVELLAAAEDADMQTLSCRVAESLNTPVTAEDSALWSANVKLTPAEQKFFANDKTYATLKRDYEITRNMLKEYQHQVLSNTAEGTVLLNEVADLQAQLQQAKQQKPAEKVIASLTTKRNHAVQELGKIYKKELANSPSNQTLQRKVADSRRALYKYAAEKLSTYKDPEAKTLLERMK